MMTRHRDPMMRCPFIGPFDLGALVALKSLSLRPEHTLLNQKEASMLKKEHAFKFSITTP